MSLEAAGVDVTGQLEADGRHPIFSRIILKLSGEALVGGEAYGIDMETLHQIARQVRRVVARGVQLAIVVGGGNIVRGTDISRHGIERVTGDYMGMLATVINALSLRDAIEGLGMQCRVQSAIAMQQVAEPFIPLRAIRHLEKGRVVIFAAGMGNPYFTTDTPAALRAAEIEADAILKGTHSGVDGVYSADPRLDADAVRYEEIGFMEVVSRDLRVMDLTAITFCRDNSIPILIFDIMQPGNIRAALAGEQIGTLIS